MTIDEFSNGFDVLYNNISSNSAPGLNDYEKSIFLTKAQDEIVKAYFNPLLNKTQQGFDGSERRQVDFSMLMRTVEGTKVTSDITLYPGSNSGYYAMPSDVLMYINETLKVTRDSKTVQLIVMPLKYTEYTRLMNKPYKRPLKFQAWRLITEGKGITYSAYRDLATLLAGLEGVTASADQIYSVINGKDLEVMGRRLQVEPSKVLCADGSLDTPPAGINITDSIEKRIAPLLGVQSVVVEIVPGPTDIIQSYTVRYVARPKPIVLADFTEEGVSLGGNIQTPQGCDLDPILHEEILQRAVELAKAAYMGDLQSQISLGQVSETNMGIVARQSN